MFSRSQALSLVTLVLMVALVGLVQYLTDHHIYVPPIVVAVAGLAATAVTGLCRSLLGSLAGTVPAKILSTAPTGGAAGTEMAGLLGPFISGVVGQLIPHIQSQAATPTPVHISVTRELGPQDLPPRAGGDSQGAKGGAAGVAVALALLGALLIAAPTACRAQAPAQAQSVAPPLRPNPKLTPGATLPVTVDDIKVPGYTQKVRHVPASVKREVYAEYGIKTHKRGEYEVDHLISLELGGSNSIKNLWPESYVTQPWNAHVKDRLENYLHREVVAGRIPLDQAQQEIATDWIGAYRKYIGEPPVPVRSSTGASPKRP